MKVGILTQPLRTNYGGILQNYALQQILKQMGHHPVTLDYGTYYSPMKWIMGEIKAKLTRRPHNVEFPHFFRAGQENLNRFISKNIVKTRPYSGLPLQNFAKRLDAIIVGSDQVWRPKCNVPIEWLNQMFLESIQDIGIKKIAFSASFGSDEWEYTEQQTRICKDLISQFDAISVREESGVQLAQNNLNRTPQWTLDPTLLLNRNDYDKICASHTPYSRPTLFAYILDNSQEKQDLIMSQAQKLGLTPFIVGANDDIKRTDSIELWLSYIKHSDYVITDSFHGTVFSIIYHRPFSVFGSSWRGSARFQSLLKMLDLTDKMVLDSKDINIAPINWGNVDKLLNQRRKESLDFLSNNLRSHAYK